MGVWRLRERGLGGSGSVEVEGSGSVEVEGEGAGGSGSVEVEGEGAGGSGSVEGEGEGAGGSGSVGVEGEEVKEGDDECGLPSTSEDAGTVRKRQRLSAIGAMADEPVQSWLDNLPRDDLQHMALLLYGRLPTIFGLSKIDTAAVVGEVLHKNERTIRRWVDDFVSNGGEFSESQQGHYVRNNTLMSLCERARDYVRENAAPRGRPNLTAGAFCQWVNNELLPNTVLDPGYPLSVSVETARKWLHELEFDVLQMSKGVFNDGHERPDVVESREKFIRKMTECGFLRPDNAPTEEAAQALPTDVPHMTKEEGEKCIVWWHDESAYNTSEDTPIL